MKAPWLPRSLAALLGLSSLAFAPAAWADDVFTSVESITRGISESRVTTLTVRGVLAGGATSVERAYDSFLREDDKGELLGECRRMFLLSLARPGRYAVSVKTGLYGSVSACTLKAR